LIRLKRAYEPAAPSDGRRILVERLWPRGLTKAAVALDAWRKELAPSPELRTWFAHDPTKWDDFCARYRAELGLRVDELRALRDDARTETITFVYAARDEQHNSARLLKEFIEQLPDGP